MIQADILDFKKRILILNPPTLSHQNDLCVSLCKIPEVLSRLCQYRELLTDNEMDIPFWVYCMTQNMKSVKGRDIPPVLNFLIGLGLFDRFLSKQGWPDYIIGTKPLVSVALGEESFEGVALLLTRDFQWNEEGMRFFLYKSLSYFNTDTHTSSLSSLKNIFSSPYMANALKIVTQMEMRDSLVFQLLSPGGQNLKYHLKSLRMAVKDFLEEDSGLKWLWPLWKKIQLESAKRKPSQTAH